MPSTSWSKKAEWKPERSKDQYEPCPTMESHANTGSVAPARWIPSKDYVIRNDKGGVIGIYVTGYAELKHTHIIVDGECSSACTLVLGNADVCSTDRGFFEFHAASYADLTAYLMTRYPQKVRDWITARGGLTTEWIGAHGLVFLPKCEAK